jgi:hypothetical protein
MIHGRVYKIYCNITGECYYGSTEQTLSRRLSKHKQDYKKWKEGKSRYVYSYKIIERGNFTISLMEEGEFENKHYMKARERYYIEKNECVNKNVPNRTKKEWREDNKEHIAEYHKEWREDNKEHIIEQQKEWREANKERKAEYDKEWYEANREQIVEQRKQKYTCECGGKYTHNKKARHFKSKKHANYLANK